MPLGSGPVGYSDWQRISNWDGPVIWELLTKAITGEAESAVIDSSRYGYIGGRAFITAEPFRLSFTWYADKAATKPLGERWVEIDPNITQPVQLRIPNMGPFVKVALLGKEGTSKGIATLRLYLTNRVDPLQLIPRQVLLLTHRKEAGDPELVTVYPTDYFAGPVTCHIETEGAGTNAFLEVERGPGIWATTDLMQVPATTTFGTQRLIVPPGAWRLTVSSAPGKALNVDILASMTGSS